MFGIIGMTFGIMALGLAAKLKMELDALKKSADRCRCPEKY
jgi:hypothetical protein